MEHQDTLPGAVSDARVQSRPSDETSATTAELGRADDAALVHRDLLAVVVHDLRTR